MARVMHIAFALVLVCSWLAAVEARALGGDDLPPIESLHSSYDSLRVVWEQHERSGRVDRTTVRLLCLLSGQGLHRSVHVSDEHAIRALLLVRQLGDRGGEGHALTCLSEIEIIRARTPIATTLAQEAALLTTQYGDRLDRLNGIVALATLDEINGRYVESIQRLDEAVSIADSIGRADLMIEVNASSVNAYQRLGVDSMSNDRIATIKRLLRNTRSAEIHAYGAFILSANSGDSTQRWTMWQRCRSIADRFGFQQVEAGVLLLKAEQLMRQGLPQDAEYWFRSALDAAQRTESTVQVMVASAGIGICLTAMQRSREALPHLRLAFNIAQTGSQKEIRAHVAMMIAQCLHNAGNMSEAYDYLDTALHLINELRDPGMAARLAGHQLAGLDARRTAVIASLDRQRRDQELFRNILVGGIAMVLMAGSWLFVVYRKNRRIGRQLEHALDRSDALLLNVLPASIADRLRAGEAQIVDHFDDVSILFLDIARFSQLAATMSAEELLMMLNRIFTICDDVIQRHGLEKIKTIGDAYMAVCGAPQPVQDHARRTGLAAIDIMRALAQDREDASASGRPAIHVRIGLHTGPAIGGIIGEQKFAYDLWGEAVNIAARMEQLGEVDRIHVTSAFKASTDQEVVQRGDVHVKGYGTMTTWWLTWH